MSAAYRVLFVFAHPDDETILCGGSIARLAAEGVEVSVLTCTLGEEGEVVLPELRELAADRADQLGGWRISELRAALGRLGSPRQYFLGGAGRWRDSGMVAQRSAHRRAFVAGELGEQARAAAKVIRQVRPHVVVTHDPAGGYGHRDHVRANHVVALAVKLAAAEAHRELEAPWQPARVYWAVVGRSMWTQAVAALARRAERVGPGATLPDGFHVVEPEVAGPWSDDEVTVAFDIRDFQKAKLAALAEHATQITVHPEACAFALSNKALSPVTGQEHYALAQEHSAPVRAGAAVPHGYEHLLTGLRRD